MGDYSPMSVSVHRVGARWPDLIALLNKYGFGLDWDDASEGQIPMDAFDVLDKAGPFTQHEGHLSIPGELTKDLEQMGIAHWIQADAKYEWDGEIVAWTEEMGRFNGIGSQGGSVLVSASAIDRAIAEYGDRPAGQLIEALHKLTGRAWRDAMGE